MKTTNIIIYINVILLSFSNFSFAQVGIGTSTPNGILDINSNIYGVVYPSVALTSTALETPVINPNGGSIVTGTTIYNTNKTTSGTNDVEPGIYSWDGSKWVTHFFKRQSQLFEQANSIRTSSSGGFVDVDNLGVAGSNTFTAKHSGTYKIEVKTNYGSGQIKIGGVDVNIAMGEGTFKFIFNGTTTLFTAKSFSAYNNRTLTVNPKRYFNKWKETYTTLYVSLIEGTTYAFSLEFDQAAAPAFMNNGDINGVDTTGQGYIGEDIPCFIEFTYLKE